MDQPHLESRVRVDLTAVVVAMRAGEPHILTVAADAPPGVGLPSGPFQSGHRTLQAGLRRWVEEQTRCRLGYVEQLYTFADHAPFQANAGASDHQTISIAYLALSADAEEDLPPAGRWRRWHTFFPWEDRRAGAPAALDDMLNRLAVWADAEPERQAERRERIRLAFGDGDRWDEERALERYELIYAAGLAPEAAYDRGDAPGEMHDALPGRPMIADHRRVLATGISRLRAKIKYRPVLFELMPPSFTLTALQKTAEALSGVPLHKQNFRRLVLNRGLVEETGGVTTETGGRPAKLVRFRPEVTLERPAPGVRVGGTRRASYP